LLFPDSGLPVDEAAAINILIVDDSHWSGLHMKETTEWIRKRYPKARMRTLVLVYLDARRPGAPTHQVDDCAFVTRDGRCELPWDSADPSKAGAHSDVDSDVARGTRRPNPSLTKRSKGSLSRHADELPSHQNPAAQIGTAAEENAPIPV
jgi:hypothetical protein